MAEDMKMASPTKLPVFTASPNKRQSLLLPRGTIASATMTASSLRPDTATGNANKGSNGTKVQGLSKRRPMTMFGLESLGATQADRNLLRDTEGGAMVSRPRAETNTSTRSGGTGVSNVSSIDEDELPMPKPRIPAGRSANGRPVSMIARSQSVRKTDAPTNGVNSAGLTRSNSQLQRPGHSRMQSYASGMSKPLSKVTESVPLRTGTKSSRPVSSDSSATQSSAEAEPSTGSRLRLPTAGGMRRSNTLSNDSSRHSRQLSGLPTPSHMASNTPQSSYSNLASKQRPISLYGAPEAPKPKQRPTSMYGAPGHLSRPAFNTNQQHFSPRKTVGPKPSTTSILHSAIPPSPPSTPPPVSPTQLPLLQTHLLQLSLLHSSFHPTYTAWATSTRKQLSSKFSKAGALLTRVQEAERGVRHARNVAALRRWGGGSAAANAAPDRLAENVNVLATVVLEASMLADPGAGGRVARVVGEFEEWLEGVRTVWERRGGDPCDPGGEEEGKLPSPEMMEFVDGMGTEWRGECAALVTRLGGLRGLLERLNQVPEEENGAESSLGRVVAGVRDLVEGMLEEVRCAADVEEAVVTREREWVGGLVKGWIGE